MGDYSLRQDNQDAVPNYNIKGAQNIAFTTTTGLLLNRWQKGISNEVTLNDNQTASTGITKDYNYWTNLEVNYTIQRGGNIRFGRLRVVGIAGGLVLSDDFDEAAGSVGVTFSLINTVGTIYDVKYTTTSTGSSAIMEYQINSMR
jgi:hypothetical protein